MRLPQHGERLGAARRRLRARRERRALTAGWGLSAARRSLTTKTQC